MTYAVWQAHDFASCRRKAGIYKRLSPSAESAGTQTSMAVAVPVTAIGALLAGVGTGMWRYLDHNASPVVIIGACALCATTIATYYLTWCVRMCCRQPLELPAASA